MRILAIDPGDRRVGLAVSDELGITAQGLDTFDRRVDGDFIAYVEKMLQQYDIGEIVVGNPIRTSGREGDSSAKARGLAEDLQSQLPVKVTLWDERFSSEEARRVLRGSRADKGAVDKLAAVIILQSYLDFTEGQT